MIDRVKNISVFALAIFLTLSMMTDSRLKAQNTTEIKRIEITRDTWFSGVGSERNCNTGGSQQLKVKSIQEMTVLDFDPAALKGRTIISATLHLRKRGSDQLRRVTVGSFASPWEEGTSPSYQQQEGSSTFASRAHPDQPWTADGGDLTNVILGCGGTLWRSADATAPDAQGWQRVAVDPSVIGARIAGVSYGLFVFDDTGSEWTRQGEQFTFRNFPNRFFFSRHAGKDSSPYLTVELGEIDRTPPDLPQNLRQLTAEEAGYLALPPGEAIVQWQTPKDAGSGTVGFFATVNGRPIPQSSIPAAREPGMSVQMHLRDLAIAPGGRIKVSVVAVDGAGNRSPVVECDVTTSSYRPVKIPGTPPPIPTTSSDIQLPRLGNATVAVVDPLDKIDPVSGEMIPQQSLAYQKANHLWNAATNTIQLAGAKNEFVGIQLVVSPVLDDLTIKLEMEPGSPIRSETSRLWQVKSKRGPLPDPVVPITIDQGNANSESSTVGPTGVRIQKKGTTEAPLMDASTPFGRRVPGQKFDCLLIELYIPHDARSGAHTGRITLEAGGETLQLNLNVWVWNFMLPDHLSFLPEMNCYGLPANEREYYRLAHAHRTVVNRVPYSQSGKINDGCAPNWDGRRLDFTQWDRRFGPLLDGSAFTDLPRSGVPIEIFYLPIHENWPSPMEGNYNGSYWADRAFPESYRSAMVEVSRQFAEHFASKQYGDTLFHCYFNNKNNFKRNGWSHGSSPWLLDEPANFQDYVALRWFGEAFHEGVREAKVDSLVKMLYRGDISRPQWQREMFDHLLDYNVVGGRAFRTYHRLVIDRKHRLQQIVLPYGTTGPIEDSNMQPVAWCLDNWSLEGDGVLPWQTIGREQSWQSADQLSLFYPGETVGSEGPIPSIRLKAYRRGQQDIEYLTLLRMAAGQPIPVWALAGDVRRLLTLDGEQRGTGASGEDAGTTRYSAVRPQDAWQLRIQIARFLTTRNLTPSKKLIDWKTPARNADAGIPVMARGVASQSLPAVDHMQPTVDPDAGPLPPVGDDTTILQGSAVLSDTMLDPTEPDRNFSGTPRDNRLRRTDICNAMLMKFKLPDRSSIAGKTLVKATLSFYVWDPSSSGNTRVCAYPITTPWVADEATWNRASRSSGWKSSHFTIGSDTSGQVGQTIIPPDRGSDIADPPLEYHIDITAAVEAWLTGSKSNLGIAVGPVVDRDIDEGHFTRIQLYGSKWQKKEETPQLILQWR